MFAQLCLSHGGWDHQANHKRSQSPNLMHGGLEPLDLGIGILKASRAAMPRDAWHCATPRATWVRGFVQCLVGTQHCQNQVPSRPPAHLRFCNWTLGSNSCIMTMSNAIQWPDVRRAEWSSGGPSCLAALWVTQPAQASNAGIHGIINKASRGFGPRTFGF